MKHKFFTLVVIVMVALLANIVVPVFAQEIEITQHEFPNTVITGHTYARRITGTEDLYKFLSTGAEDNILILEAEGDMNFEIAAEGDDEILLSGHVSTHGSFFIRKLLDRGWYIIRISGESLTPFELTVDRIGPEEIFEFEMEINRNIEVGAWPNREWQILHYLIPEHSTVRVEEPAGIGNPNWFLYEEQNNSSQGFIAFEIRQMISGDGNKVYLWGDFEDTVHDRDAGQMNVAVIKILPL